MKIKSIILVVVCMGLIAIASTAIAEDNQCKLLKTQPMANDENEVRHFINPKEISHVAMVTDKSIRGTSPRLVLIVIMNNEDKIFYGRYTNELDRIKDKDYISEMIFKCGQ